MFDIAWSEMALIMVVALIVIGPRDLPKVMATVGRWTRKIRLMAGDFQRSVDEMAREAELDALRKQVRSVAPGMNKLETLLEKAALGDEPGAKSAFPPVAAPSALTDEKIALASSPAGEAAGNPPTAPNAAPETKA
ncbi:hypothetical protein FACS1894205_6850 [Alphaproteobacteria bacterium]|nr:hypothetical protein FACS1894205_6850 [Alphaproteobacteria bacterium]